MDYSSLVKKCKSVSDFSEPILTEIMYYAADRDKLGQRFDLLAKRHKKVFGRLAPENQNMFKSQYIIHELFKNKGLIHKYLNHSRIKTLPKEEYRYLQQQAENPWKFTFWFIRRIPHPDFYEIVDIVTGEEILLYSPGASRTLQEMNVKTFGGLISNNGECYQTYGPLMGFRSFETDDIFFYASELDPSIETIEDMGGLIAKYLFSFLLLSVYSAIPLIVHGGYDILYVLSSLEMESFEMDIWKEDFRIEYSNEVFKMSFKELQGFPHFACVYYDEGLNEITLSAMTDYGYDRLVSKLQTLGIEADVDPHIRLHLSMRSAILEITGKEPLLLPYENNFSQAQASKENNPEIASLNKFLVELIPAINSKANFDLDELINRTGADPQAAKEIYQDLMKKLGR